MTAATEDIGDVDELVVGGATHLVQIVLVLVDKMVERLVACRTEVVPWATLVVVIWQLVTVVYTISLTTLATVEFAVIGLLMPKRECVLADIAMVDDVCVTTIVVAGWVDVTMTFDVMGVLRAGQLRTLEAQAVMITWLVLKTVFSGMRVVAASMLEDVMLDEVAEPLVLCMELATKLEMAVLLTALMLL